LLKALTFSEAKFVESYGAAMPAGLRGRIDEARRRLTQIPAK
jgi:hypothetical protein